ncbi:hypothetical protein [Clostridium cylindrosporum]|uniref:Uncharacterized protein n=1 Tax=Clostridium cylindrosporum DSM 605 TaxID=1121307 RepID=A0A0J8DAB6_CLOCY|nr:hypothetical protein [Clostridium cylindrosporum]KMT22985.1 hypothetical protein CLCY_7c00320 [Clostridium cylindrosporum DSM 605]
MRGRFIVAKKGVKEQYLDRIAMLEDEIARTSNPVLKETYESHISFLREELASL